MTFWIALSFHWPLWFTLIRFYVVSTCWVAWEYSSPTAFSEGFSLWWSTSFSSTRFGRWWTTSCSSWLVRVSPCARTSVLVCESSLTRVLECRPSIFVSPCALACDSPVACSPTFSYRFSSSVLACSYSVTGWSSSGGSSLFFPSLFLLTNAPFLI